jgi:hypothetical protein
MNFIFGHKTFWSFDIFHKANVNVSTLPILSTQKGILNLLNDDAINLILQYCNVQDIFSFGLSSKRLNILSNKNILWNELTKNCFKMFSDVSCGNFQHSEVCLVKSKAKLNFFKSLKAYPVIIAQDLSKSSPRLIIVLNNKIYDLTEFESHHPGGADILHDWVAKDATKIFKSVSHSLAAIKKAELFLIWSPKYY